MSDSTGLPSGTADSGRPAWLATTRGNAWCGAGGATRVMEAATVSEDFFDVLGLPAARGVVPRVPGGDARAVISAPLARAFEDRDRPVRPRPGGDGR